MVVKMMRWRPWPPLVARKYEVRLVVNRLEGFDPKVGNRLTVEIKWKGPKLALGPLRRMAVKRNFTREADCVDENGVVQWDEEFQSSCSLSAYKENVFHPWEIAFTAFNGLPQGQRNKIAVVGTASLNISEYVSEAAQKELELNIPLTTPSGSLAEHCPVLSISLSFVELRTAQETSDPIERSMVLAPSPPQSAEPVSTEKDDFSAFKAGLRKVNIFRDLMSSRKLKKASSEEEGSEGRCYPRSDDGDYSCTFDSDSLDDSEDGETDESKENSSVRKSFSYGTLAYANCVGGSFFSDSKNNGESEDWIYYSHRKSDVGCSNVEKLTPSASEPSLLQSSKRLLSWRKRKLSFRSPKAKGEPLLKKAYGEEGGDDIDYDRRQLSSDESLTHGGSKTEDDLSVHRSSASEFGDDNFAVGSWEQKEVISRDGQMKLQTQVFFASIDQRSEQAAGESACTALVAVIADWFQNNRDVMPIKSQFDSLIREGSLEWRNLCENEAYRRLFPDKHFDLDTVLKAKIRPLSVVHEKSFIGFFHPEGVDEGRFDFLHGAMSFDNIWDEISCAGCPSNDEPMVYIVSWNDHFFILKVEPEAYYIIDTLGERLYEGCSQAYILKFDSNTTISKVPAQSSDEKPSSNQQIVAAVQGNSQENNGAEEEEVLCRGKESCKEYIKNFLAAIPIRELQADIKKGLMASTPLHHRLQIELHYTHFLQPSPDTTPAAEANDAASKAIDVAIAEVAA